MRGSGYSESVTNEVCAALGILAKYGVLGVGVGMGLTNGTHQAPLNFMGVSAMEQSANAAHAAHAAAASGGVYGAIGQVNLDSFIGTTSPTPRASLERYEATFDPFRHNSQAATPISLNNNTFGLATNASSVHAQAALNAAAVQQTLGALSNKSPTPGELGNKDIKNVEIPEVIVGAILGKWWSQN
jgi:RNA-binding protein Nova